MKNQHSYYFHKLLTECIKVGKPDNKPTLMIGATIKLLREYADDYHKSPTDDRRRILQNAADSINSMADYLEYNMRTMSPNMIPIAAEDLASAKSSAMELKKEFSLE